MTQQLEVKVIEPDNFVRPISPRTVAIERCAEQIERAIGALTVHQRIGLARALDQLTEEVEWNCRRQVWS